MGLVESPPLIVHPPWPWDRFVHLPVNFVMEVLGGTPDPWQCDVLDANIEYDRVAIRACHGVGKTTTLAWAIIHFLITRPWSTKIATTAPTFNKQVKMVLWGEIEKWWRPVASRYPGLYNQFEFLRAPELHHKDSPANWMATGFASQEPFHSEGFHADHVLAVFDEAKAINPRMWESIAGIRTTQEAKFLVASTPGFPAGEFYRVFQPKFRTTWKTTFIIRPVWLKEKLLATDSVKYREIVGADPETGQPTPGRYSKRGGTYYSDRVRKQWVEEQAIDWGEDSAAFIARVIGDFPEVEGNYLLKPEWVAAAEDRQDGCEGPIWVSCDVARGGKDRTVVLAGRGGTVLAGVTASRFVSESTAPEVRRILETRPDDPSRAYDADTTAAICARLRLEYDAEGICVDDTGFGGGVTSVLKMWGEKVIPVNFGYQPTDTPKTPEEKKARQKREMIDTHFRNIKAQMAWALRGAFQRGDIALGRLPNNILEPLTEQAKLMRQTIDPAGRIKITDPDDEEDLIDIAPTKEGKRSPDHFHALMLLWFATSGLYRGMKPRMGAPSVLAPGVARVGRAGTPQVPFGAPPGQRTVDLTRMFRS